MYRSRNIPTAFAVTSALVIVFATAATVSAQNPATSDPVHVTNKDSQTGIQVLLSSNKRAVAVGEEIILSLQADRNCHAILLHISETGKITVLWPNADRGWDDSLVAGRSITVTGEGTGIRIRPDGRHPNESFASVASSESNAIYRWDDFVDAAGGRLKAYPGDPEQLGRVWEERIQKLPGHVKWGGVRLVVSVGTDAGGPGQVSSQAGGPLGAPFALRTSQGKYLSVKGGEPTFSATQVGPTEVFRFQPVANDQFKIVAGNGSSIVRTGDAAESLERRQAFDPWLRKAKDSDTHHAAFRTSDGRYMAVGADGSGLVFDDCFATRPPHRGLFILVPVKGQADRLSDAQSHDWNIGPKVLALPDNLELPGR